MRKYIFIIVVWSFWNCNQTNSERKKELPEYEKHESKPGEKFVINSNGEIYIVVLDNYHYPPIYNNNATLDKIELRQINQILERTIEEYNNNHKQNYKYYKDKTYTLSEYLIDLSFYKRQYLPFFNSKGEKEVWINCFCHVRDDKWLSKYYSVDDGGKCYFNLYINLANGKSRQLWVNA